jgi:hypothetical protein
MTHVDALEAIKDHPHCWRFRELCADDNPDVEQRDAYRGLVVQMAGGEPLPDITAHLAEAAQQEGPAVKTCGSC